MNPLLIDMPEEILGKRIVIQPRRPNEGDEVWEAIEESREQITPWLPWAKYQLTREEPEMSARRAWAKWQTREDLAMVIRDRVSGRYLGGSGLHSINWDVPKFEIGYWLRTSAVGNGYVTEAVQVLCSFAFDTLKANRIEIRCDSRNERSIAVPARLGFILEAHLRNDLLDNNKELRDTLVYALTPSDFARAKVRWDNGDLSAR